MAERVTAIAGRELALRVGRTAVLLTAASASATALMEVLTPVVVNGDPLTLGLNGTSAGAFSGTFVGVLVAIIVLFVLLGGDLDRGLLAERVHHGGQPIRIALGQGLAAVVAGVGAWAATALATGVGGLADLAYRTTAGLGAGRVTVSSSVTTFGASGPGVVLCITALLWLLIVSFRSGTRALVTVAALVLTFLLALTSLPLTLSSALVMHPLAGVWRAISALRVGQDLPGARHDAAWPYVISTACWGALLLLAAVRGVRRLATE